MKKAGIFAIVLAVVLGFMQLYNYKLIGYMESDSYGAQSKEVVQNLTSGAPEGADPKISMTLYEKSTAIFKRGKHLFTGDKKEELDTKLPLYVNDGQAVLNLADSGSLIDTDFGKVPVYEGLYVMDGMSFNRDREQADPEEFILLSLENSVYMCAQTAIINGALGETQIAENSIAYFGDDLVRYYSFEEGGSLSFHEMTGVKDARISIGSMDLSWPEFIRKLKGAEESDGKTPEAPTTAEETTEESAAETLPETTAKPETQPETAGTADLAAESVISPAEESSAQESLTAEVSLEGMEASGDQGTSAAFIQNSDLKDRNSGNKDEFTTAWEDITDGSHSSDHPTYRDDSTDADSGNNQETSSSAQETSSSAAETTEAPTSTASSSNGTPAEPVYPFNMPKVKVEDFKTGVYNISAKVTISDPDGRIIKGVRLALYKENSLYMRKLVKEDGTVVMTPLEPDTQYYIEGYFDYYGEDGHKWQYTFLVKMKVPEKTKPLSYLKAIEVSQKWSGKRYVDKAEINAISIKDEETDGTEKESAIPYIDTMICQMSKNGRSADDKINVPIDTTTLYALRNQKTVDWMSGEILESNSTYDYELLFRDRFGNALVTKPEKVGGTLETSKQPPEADIRVDRNSSVETTIINVKMDNPDSADFLTNTSLGAHNPYFTVAYVDDPDIPLSLKINGEEEEVTMVPIDQKGQTKIEITNLAAGRQYQIRVRGSYDILDGETHENEVLGTANYTTGRLNTLGTVNYNFVISDITATSARIRSSLRTGINSVLEPYISKMVFDIRKMDSKEGPAYQLVLDREKLSKVMLTGKETVIPKDAVEEIRGADADDHPFEAEIKLLYPTSDASISVWEALTNSGTLDVYFPDGNMGSATQYVAEMHAYASQALEGSSEEEVTGRYYNKTFKTLRMPAQVEVEKWFVTNSYVELLGLKINDPDGAVKDGKLSVRLIQNANNKVLDVQNTTVDEINEKGKLTFTNLKKDMEYRIEFYALEYNETYSSLNEVTFYRLPIKNGTEETSDSIRFMAGSTMWGSIDLLSLDSAYEKGMYDASGENLFVINDATFSEIDSKTGEISARTDNIYVLSGLIPVEAGKFYQLTGAGQHNGLYCFREDGSYLTNITMGWGYFWRLIRIPADTAYVRFYVQPDYLTETCFMKADIDLNNAPSRPENLAKGIDYTAASYIYSDGIRDNASYSVTDFIEVEESAEYVKLNTGSGVATLAYYDENHNMVGYATWNPNTDYGDYSWGTVPENKGIKYARFNIKKGMEDKFYVAKVDDGSYGKNMFESSMVKEQGVYFNEYNTKTTNSIYWYSDLIEVEPDTTYYKSTSFGFTQLYDANRKFIGFVNREGMFRTSADTKYIRINGQVARLTNTANPVTLRKLGPAQVQNQQFARFKVTVEDNESYLAETKDPSVQVLVQSAPLEGGDDWTTENTINIPITVENGKVKKLETEISLALGGGKRYRAVLQAELTQFDHTLQMDESEVTTDKQRYLIRSEAGFASIVSDPMGEYVATADVRTEYMINLHFYGKVDFQGHQITKEYTQRGTASYLISYLEKGAVIENLNYDLTWHTNNPITYTSGLVQYNYGTIQNLIAHIKVNNQANNYGYAGLIYQNLYSGRLENFAVVLDEDFVINQTSAVGIKDNYGMVRNGYICTENGSRIVDYTPEGAAVAKGYRGGFVATNSVIGTVEQVYSLVQIETNTPASSTAYVGTLVGYSNGTVQNSFTTAHDLLDGKPAATYGPAVGGSGGRMVNKNVRYVQVTEYDKGEKGYYVNSLQSESELQALADQSWYDYSINLDGHFQTDMVPAGYYPRLDMPECIVSEQPLLNLPTLVQPQAPTLVSANVVEQQEDGNYLAEFSFINPQNMRITAIQLSDRSGSYPNYVFTKALTCTIQSQQMDQDGVYRVRAVLSDPTVFRSRYYVDYFEAKAQSAGANQRPYQVTDRTNSIYAAFYRDIANLNDWTNYVKTDLYGNFRLVADLDFSRVPYTLLGNYLINRSFYGSIDGAYTTAGGERKNHRIVGLNSQRSGYMFESVYDGVFSNIDVVDFKSDEPVQASRIGWIKYAARETFKNVHVLDSAITVGNYGGLLAAAMDNCVIQDCSVTNSKITSWEYVDSVLGGFAGYLGNCVVENCFTEGVEIDAVNARSSTSSGIGGFVGNGSYSTFRNCYAQGSINTSIPDVGGFAGAANNYGSNSFENLWTKVDITTATGNVGGIVGRATSVNIRAAIAAGGIFSRSGEAANINRIIGYAAGGNSYFAQTAAYAGQYLGSKIQPDLATNEGVLATAEDFRDSNFYEGQLGMDLGQFDEDASQAGDGCGIGQGYLPRLLSTEGTLLPHQTPVSITATTMELSVDAIQGNSNAANQFKQMFGDNIPYPTSWTSAYLLNFYVDGANGYKITDVSLSGMDLNAYYKVGGEDHQTFTENSQGGRIVRSYPFLQMEVPYDRYVLNVTMTPEDMVDETGNVTNHTQDVLLSTTVEPQDKFMISISNAAEWNEVMSKYKDSYGNFEIRGDIDASTLKEGESLITGVRVNRLVSYQDKYSIKNVTIDTEDKYESLIKESTSLISNLKFENITVRYTKYSDNQSVGVIGQNNGKIQNVDFENIMIDAGKTTYTGCVGMSNGEIENVNLKDIQVKGTNYYVGGLVGYATAAIRDISAKGSITDSGDYTYRVYSTNHYAGGIAGAIQTNAAAKGYRLHIDTIKVVSSGTNLNNISLGVGQGHVSSDLSTDIENIHEEDYNTITNSVLVKIGTGSAVGGMVGNGHAYYTKITDCRIQAPDAKNVGGISSNGSTYGSISERNVIIGGDYTGGATGKSDWNSLSYTTVRDCIIQGANYVGGMSGNGRIITSQKVESTKITGNSYVGGMLGMLTGSVDTPAVVANSEIKGVEYVGGMIGATQSGNSTISNLVVSGTKIQASMNTEDGRSYAGGIVGLLRYIQAMRACVTDENTTIDAAGDYVGGLAGYVEGGYHHHNYSAAKINMDQDEEAPMGSYVGGLYGGFRTSDKAGAAAYRETYLSTSYFSGTVRGQNYVGGLIGVIEKGDTGSSPSVMTKDRFFQLLMAGDVESRVTDNTAQIRPDANIPEGTDPGEIDLFRIYDQSTENGIPFADSLKYLHIENQIKAVGEESGSSGSGAGSIDFSQPMFASASSLSTEEFYTRPKELGGMNWSKAVRSGETWTTGGGWNFEGLMNMKAYPLNVNMTADHELTLGSSAVTDGSHKVTVALSGYATDGLKMHYDGIQNTRTGHSNETRTLENLTGDSHYDLKAENLNFNRSVNDKGIYSGDGWIENAYSNASTTTTPFSWKAEESSGERWETLTMSATFSRTNTSWGGLIGFNNYDKTPSVGMHLYPNSTHIRLTANSPLDVSANKNIADGKVHNVTSVWNYSLKTQTLYVDGELIYKRTNLGDWAPSDGFPKVLRLMGVANGTDDTATHSPLRGNLYNAKVYDRELSEDEIRQNYQTDIERFGEDGTKETNDGTEVVIYQQDVEFTNGKAEIILSDDALKGIQSGDLKVMVTDGDEAADSANAVKGVLHNAPLSSKVLSCTVASSSDATGKTTVEAEVESADGTYQWYRSDVPGYCGVAVKGENADAVKAVLLGRGYYYCKVTSGNSTSYTPIIPVETNAFLPYVNRAGTKYILEYQEGYSTTDREKRIELKTGELFVGDTKPYTEEAPEFMQKDITLYPSDVDTSTGILRETWFSGGASLKNSSKEYLDFGLSLLAIQAEPNSDPEAIPSLTVYPSGIDRINLEFDSKWSPEYYVIVKDSYGNTLMQNMDQRVYTMSYDFKSELTVTVGNHVVSNTWKIDPTKLRRTVMTYGDKYYYLSEGNIYSTELLAEGDYIHLYGGMALSSDGEIRILDDSLGAESPDGEISMTQLLETTPLYEFDYDGTKITTYEHFSVIDGDADGIPDAEPKESADNSADQTISTDGAVAVDINGFPAMQPVVDGSEDQDDTGVVRELKLVVKDGDLYALDTNESISGSFVTDTYQDQTWIMLTGEDGKAKNLADTMKWPSGTAKTGIAHTTNNLDCSEPWILIRYKSGYVKGFNYVTGEELTLTNPKSDLSLIDYIGNFFNDKLADLKRDDNQGYLDLISLKKKLTVHPIDDSMFIDGDKVDGAGQETSETEFAKDGSGDTLIGQGAENGTGSGENGTAADDSGTVSGKTGETAVSGGSGSAGDNGNTGEAGDTTEGSGSQNAADADQNAEAAESGSAADTNESQNDADAMDPSGADENDSAENGEAENKSEKDNESESKSDKTGEVGNKSEADRSQSDKTGESGSKSEADGSQSDKTGEVGSKSEADGSQSDKTGEVGSKSEADGSQSDKTGESGSKSEADGSQSDKAGESGSQSEAGANESGKTGGTEADKAGADVSGKTNESQSAVESAAAETSEAASNADRTEAQPAQRTKYTYVYNTEKKEYELYKTSELLDPSKELILSEQEKIRTLAARGVMVGADDDGTQTVSANKQEKTGLTFLLIAGLSAIGLAGLIIYRKKRYE